MHTHHTHTSYMSQMHTHNTHMHIHVHTSHTHILHVTDAYTQHTHAYTCTHNTHTPTHTCIYTTHTPHTHTVHTHITSLPTNEGNHGVGVFFSPPTTEPRDHPLTPHTCALHTYNSNYSCQLHPSTTRAVVGVVSLVGVVYLPYSSKFLRHKNFVKHSKFAKLLIFVLKNFMIAAKFHEAWRGLIVAVVPCITTSLCLFLGCVLLIRSSFG